MNYDVIVVGGGPAGSSAAHDLAQQGVHVCVLEKYRMPRYKTCGGGVNVRAARQIPFSIEPIVEREVSTYRFTYRGERPFERTYHLPLTFMTQRLRLDKFLLDKAGEAGAEIREGVTVRQVQDTASGVEVTTDSGDRYHAAVVIGADGANSIVARSTGLMCDMRREIALESEIPLSTEEMDAWGDKVEIDLFTVRYGYGWVFPKQSHISIGVGGLQADIKAIQRYNSDYLQRHDVATRMPLRFSGHALPVRTRRSEVARGHVLLIGDAAGLLEPFTGEGIGYAVKSGRLAARIVSTFVHSGSGTLADYPKDLDAEVTSELLLAQQYVRTFNRFPRVFYRLVRDSDYAWSAACKILRGERQFADIEHRLGILQRLVALC